jgi:hypothetical protein
LTCNVFKSPRMSLREALAAFDGSEPCPPPRNGMSEKQYAQVLQRFEQECDEPMPELGPIIMCGDLVVPVCPCGVAADFLCDYPMGKGKTCDLPLCADCRHAVDDDTDLCRLHRAEFRARAGVEQISQWPPKRTR